MILCRCLRRRVGPFFPIVRRPLRRPHAHAFVRVMLRGTKLVRASTDMARPLRVPDGDAQSVRQAFPAVRCAEAAATSSLRCRCVGPSRASAVNQSERRRHSCWRDRVGTRPSSSTTRKCGAILCTSSQTSGSFCPRCLLRDRVGLHTISPGIPRRVGYRVTASRVRVPQRESWRGSPP